jgi:hypothetical protein
MDLTLSDGTRKLYDFNGEYMRFKNIHKINYLNPFIKRMDFNNNKIKHLCEMKNVSVDLGYNKIRKIPNTNNCDCGDNRIKSCKTKYKIPFKIGYYNKIKDWSYVYGYFSKNKYYQNLNLTFKLNL